MARRLITEQTVRQALRTGEALIIGPDDIITPAAKDLIRSSNLPLRRTEDSGAGRKTTAAQSRQGASQVRGSGAYHSLFDGKKRVALGSDHGGYPMKEMLKDHVISLGFDVIDLGTDSPERTDYPVYARAVALSVQKGESWRGIIVDGAGIGSAVAANKFKGIRAAMAYDTLTANNCREHNDANILTLGGLLLGVTTAREIVRIFLNTEFDPRHASRIALIEGFENENFSG